MIVLVVWIAAAAIILLTLGIVGFQVAGQAMRLRQTIGQARSDLWPTMADLLDQMPPNPSSGRHSVEHHGTSRR